MRNENARLPGTAPSSALDGLDMTVAEARAMPQEEFARLFGLASLDGVPLVGPGYLKHPPKDSGWYLRVRLASADRKTDVFQLVVKAPQRALPEAGGGIAVNPMRIALEAQDADGARLEALVKLARASGRRRRATEWPIPRIQALLVNDVLDLYVEQFLPGPAAGVDGKTVEFTTQTTYRAKIRAFQRAFPGLEVGDFGNWIVKEYDRRAPDRRPNSRASDLFTVRRALREGLALLGVPPTYLIDVKIKAAPRLPKQVWTPQEYDRLRLAADNWLFNADGTPQMVAGPDGPVHARFTDNGSAPYREAWRRAIPFLAFTGSRNGRLPATRWVPPEVEPMDGLPLKDRPWVEVTDGEIIYHRDGEMRYDGNKRRGPLIIPEEFAPQVRAWYEADVEAGYEFVFHKKDGSRYRGKRLDITTFHNIAADAGLPKARIPHHLKDLTVEWSDESEGMDRETLAAHVSTEARTIARKYGEVRRTAKLLQAAALLKTDGWRAKADRRSELTRRFDRRPDPRDAGQPVLAPKPSRPAENNPPRRNKRR